MTQILREAAEIRDELAQARSAEDDRLARAESEACMALVRVRGSSGSGPASRRDRPGSAAVSDRTEPR